MIQEIFLGVINTSSQSEDPFILLGKLVIIDVLFRGCRNQRMIVRFKGNGKISMFLKVLLKNTLSRFSRD